MNIERVFEIFRETGVMLDGHFLFTSGRHGGRNICSAPSYSGFPNTPMRF